MSDDPVDDDWSDVWQERYPCGCCTCCGCWCWDDDEDEEA